MSFLFSLNNVIISSTEPKAHGELIVVEPASVRACVRPFTFSNLYISKTTSPIVIKFDLKHH